MQWQKRYLTKKKAPFPNEKKVQKIREKSGFKASSQEMSRLGIAKPQARRGVVTKISPSSKGLVLVLSEAKREDPVEPLGHFGVFLGHHQKKHIMALGIIGPSKKQCSFVSPSQNMVTQTVATTNGGSHDGGISKSIKQILAWID